MRESTVVVTVDDGLAHATGSRKSRLRTKLDGEGFVTGCGRRSMRPNAERSAWRGGHRCWRRGDGEVEHKRGVVMGAWVLPRGGDWSSVVVG